MAVLDGACKWRFGLVRDEATGEYSVKTDIIDAERARRAKCPVCGGELVARKGEFRSAHWAHLHGDVCDSWYEPKGEWHRYWQGLFPREWEEVCVVNEPPDGERHVADIKTADGWVIEFQFSHISPENIKRREDFYGSMVWVVCGTRLTYDQQRFLVVKNGEFVTEGVSFPYAVVRKPTGRQPQVFNRFWSDREKLVFFDFDGTFANPSRTGFLYCLIPGTVDGAQVVVRVTQQEFVAGFESGQVVDFIGKLNDCRRHFELGEARILRQHEELQRWNAMTPRKQYEIDPIRYAITCGWIEAWLYICGRADSVSDLRVSGVPEMGKIAFHLMSEYSEDAYKKDLALATEMGIASSRDVPSYSTLSMFKGSIVAAGSFYMQNDGTGDGVMVFKAVRRIMGQDGNALIVPDIPDGDVVWQLNGEQMAAVNGFHTAVNGFCTMEFAEQKPREANLLRDTDGMVYTGKGNLYRDAKTGWLHILQGNVFVPLTKEHQDWDKTYDTAHRRRYW